MLGYVAESKQAQQQMDTEWMFNKKYLLVNCDKMKASFLCCYKFSFFLFHECVISQSEGSGLVFMSLDGEPSRTTFETLCLIKLAPYPDILM